MARLTLSQLERHLFAARAELMASFLAAFETKKPSFSQDPIAIPDSHAKNSVSDPSAAQKPGFSDSQEKDDSIGKNPVSYLMLSRHQFAGVIAGWWEESLYGLKALAAQGFLGLVDSWIATIRTLLDAEKSRREPLDHRLVQALLPAYLQQLAGLEDEIEEIEAQIAEAQAVDEEDEDEEETLSPAEIKALKRKARELKNQVKALEAELMPQLEGARAELSEDKAQQMVLEIFRNELGGQLHGYAVRQRQETLNKLERWWAKYQISLNDVERERRAFVDDLDRLLQKVGYANS